MFRLHFTDEAMAQMSALGLDQDRVRTAIQAGTKSQGGENLLLVRHRDLEVEVATWGPDYKVSSVRLEQAWPKGKPTLHYLDELSSGIS